MENQGNRKGIIINYGLILGGLTVLIQLGKYAMGKHLQQEYVSGTVAFLLMVVLIVLGIKKYKQSNDGFLSFSDALKAGVGIALISALMAVVYQFVFMEFIEPDFTTLVLDKSYEMLQDQGYSEDQIETSIAITKKMMNPAVLSAISIISSIFLGFVISAIAGAVMKKDKSAQY